MSNRDTYIQTQLTMHSVEIQKQTEQLMQQGMSKYAAEAAAKARFISDLSVHDPVLRHLS